MAAFGMVVAYLLARPPRRLGALGSVVKLFGLAALLVVAVLLLGRIQSYLLDKGIDPAEGVNSVLAESARRTSGGGSGFQAPSTSTSLASLPYAAVTILFRPFPFEAHNAQSAVTALESFILLCLTVARSRSIWQAIRHLRRWPYVAFILVYAAGFVVAFASIANFGILARERVQLLPFQRRTSDPPPTAYTLVGESAVTADSPAPSTAGAATLRQLWPFQCSTHGTCHNRSRLNSRPTAQTSLLASATTPMYPTFSPRRTLP
jgi:hypothetical protein